MKKKLNVKRLAIMIVLVVALTVLFSTCDKAIGASYVWKMYGITVGVEYDLIIKDLPLGEHDIILYETWDDPNIISVYEGTIIVGEDPNSCDMKWYKRTNYRNP